MIQLFISLTLIYLPPPHTHTPHHITSHHITSHHITSHHITSHHITSHTHLHITLGKAKSSGAISMTLPEDVNEPVELTSEGEKGCESCHMVTAARWYNWSSAHKHCRLCNYCYTYWRKYGGLKLPSKQGELFKCVGFSSLFACICFHQDEWLCFIDPLSSSLLRTEYVSVLVNF